MAFLMPLGTALGLEFLLVCGNISPLLLQKNTTYHQKIPPPPLPPINGWVLRDVCNPNEYAMASLE